MEIDRTVKPPPNKILNKERSSGRGPKQRYAVWRAELNKKWELCYEGMVREICVLNDFNLEEVTKEAVGDKEYRDHWHVVYNYLRYIKTCYHDSIKNGMGRYWLDNEILNLDKIDAIKRIMP